MVARLGDDRRVSLADRVTSGARTTLRRRTRLGLTRLRLTWWGAAQSALAGALAWEFAVHVLGHSGPFFAAVAAIVCLSTTYLNRLRRVVEMGIGVTLGVAIGDAVVREIGRGGWQIGAVVLVAMLVALLLDGAPLIINQAALQAVFVTALPPPVNGYVARWEDALVGGVVALVVAFALPSDPRPAMRDAGGAVVHPIADALRQSATAARVGDVERAFDALEQARATQPAIDRWRDAVRAGEEVSRLSPLRRHALAEISAHRAALAPVDRAIRNVRVALRRAVAAAEDEQALGGRADPSAAGSSAATPADRDDGASTSPLPVVAGSPAHLLPPSVVEVLDGLASVFYTLPGALRDRDGEGGRRAVAALDDVTDRLRPERLEMPTMNATVIVAQVRSAVVDLIQVPGVPEHEARAKLPR